MKFYVLQKSILSVIKSFLDGEAFIMPQWVIQKPFWVGMILQALILHKPRIDANVCNFRTYLGRSNKNSCEDIYRRGVWGVA